MFTGTICEKDPDLWFNESQVAQAIALCGTCPFKMECRKMGEDQDFGVWGGVDMAVVKGARAIRLTTRDEKYALALELWNGPETLTKSEIGLRTGLNRNTVTWVIARSVANAA